MKKNLVNIFLIIALVFAGCKDKGQEHEGHDAQAGDVVETSPNEALYNEVMKIHDEAMSKMDDINKSTQELKAKLEQSPNLSEKEKMELNAIISRLDSADNGMRVWMRQFNPIPDSVGEEKAREYLEGEMEKIKRVREDMLQALEQAKTKN